jgi:hypothetical protein
MVQLPAENSLTQKDMEPLLVVLMLMLKALKQLLVEIILMLKVFIQLLKENHSTYLVNIILLIPQVQMVMFVALMSK